MKIIIKNCSQCGSNKINFAVPQGDNKERYICKSCGFIHYQNPNIVAGSIFRVDDKVLLCKRAIEPRINCWTLPAGFLENEEPLETGAARECIEEANAYSDDMKIFLYTVLIHISQIYIMYYGTLKNGKHSPGLESHLIQSFTQKMKYLGMN